MGLSFTITERTDASYVIQKGNQLLKFE